MKPVSRMKYWAHFSYRFIVWTLVVMYNLQHVIRVIKSRHSTEEVVDTLFVLLTTLNTLGKQIAFNSRSRRIDRLITAINGPYFAPTNSYDVRVLKENAVTMSRLLLLYHIAIFICGALWTIFPLVNRATSENVEFTGYFPFDTTPSPVFELALAYMSFLITLQAYGNVTMDCTIVAFYAQGKIQLQMLRYDLEHLVDVKDGFKEIDSKLHEADNQYFTYVDIENVRFKQKIQERLVRCVKHYQQIVWFINEVESIFGEALVIQLVVMAWVICMTMYKIAGLSLMSAEFISMAMYLGCMLAQLFIYCYYGTQLKFESEFVNQSIFFGNWLALSPGFRRQLLLMMMRYSRAITPRIAYVIPMSLETYIQVLRSSYTLFTFLDRK
uniref:Odorant receptor n=1 Tax=Streltzoviella insularis TaxID=1206366 RepID=A0A7D5UMN6_9NEOP|nr:odorant receptor 49 [Streltzoviella insularis]